MSPDVANIIDDTLTRAVTVFNTATKKGLLGIGNLNQSS